MRGFVSFVVVLGLVLNGASPAQEKKKGKEKGGKKDVAAGATVLGERGEKADAYLREDLDRNDGGFCGSALVAVGGKIVLEKGYGPADEKAGKEIGVDALWDWASVSKQFTAAAVLRLQDMKKLDVDDPLKKFFPKAPADKAEVTLRQLLNHTSGIQSGFRGEWNFDANSRDSLIDLVLSLPMESKPGEKFDYSNSGYGFLAALVEKVSGKTFEEFCEKELFERAGLKGAKQIGMPGLDLARVPKIARGKGFTDRSSDFAFAYGNRLTWGYRGCGGFVLTTGDMFLWDRALRGEKLLSKASKADLYTVGKNDYALGWEVKNLNGAKVAAHSGGVLGVATYYVRGLDDDFCIALAYSSEPKTPFEAVAGNLLRLARGK